MKDDSFRRHGIALFLTVTVLFFILYYPCIFAVAGRGKARWRWRQSVPLNSKKRERREREIPIRL